MWQGGIIFGGVVGSVDCGELVLGVGGKVESGVGIGVYVEVSSGVGSI